MPVDVRCHLRDIALGWHCASEEAGGDTGKDVPGRATVARHGSSMGKHQPGFDLPTLSNEGTGANERNHPKERDQRSEGNRCYLDRRGVNASNRIVSKRGCHPSPL